MPISVNHFPVITLITYTICGTIIISFIVAWICRRLAHKENRPAGPGLAATPGVVISIGIFGTFLGIYLGLMDFNTADINNSIPSLLEGLKTAFITSLFGMFFSIVLKYLFSFYDKQDLQNESIASGDPSVLLRQISTNITTLTETVVSLGDVIFGIFRSDEETSIISQLKLIRTEMIDLKREVTKTLRDFGEKVAELGTEAMIEALRQVIEQFNARLNDLVGEEFKQLKEAMIELNRWQISYRDSVNTLQSKLTEYLVQVELSSELLEKAASSIGRASEHFDSIDGSLSTISISAVRWTPGFGQLFSVVKL